MYAGVAAVAAGCGGTVPSRRPEHAVRLRAVGRASAADLDRAAAVLRERLDRLGVHDVSVARRGRTFVVGLPGRRTPRGFDAVTRQGRLEFFDLEPSLAAGPAQHPPKLRPGTVVVTCGRPAPVCPLASGAPGLAPRRRRSYYLFKLPPAMSGADVRPSGTRQDVDAATNQPIVIVSFTRTGARKFTRITRAEFRRGRARGVSQHFAIVLDRELQSFPQIDFTDATLRNGINSAAAQIVGVEAQEAKRLAIVLQTGALPIRFVRVR